jgi:hypothetical protein
LAGVVFAVLFAATLILAEYRQMWQAPSTLDTDIGIRKAAVKPEMVHSCLPI